MEQGISSTVSLSSRLAAGGCLLALGFVGGEALDKLLQLGDLFRIAFVFIADELLHQLAGFVPEIVVADI